MPPAYQTFFDVVTRILLALAVLGAVVAVVDWAIRARHINPFSPIARFFRRWIDPLLRPMETMIVRRGGQPQQAPFYAFMAVIVGGIALLWLLRFAGALYVQLRVGVSSPDRFGWLVIGWALNFLTIALVVRVISSWLPISPFSKWIRWSYVCTEWFMAPLRRIIPPFGQIDLSPLVAYFLLRIVGGVLGV
jgi:YggT family protein